MSQTTESLRNWFRHVEPIYPELFNAAHAMCGSYELAEYALVVEAAVQDLAPHKICQYVYELSDVFNGFYHETKILAEEDEARKRSYIALITLTGRVLSCGIGLLGFAAPERM